jgi:hypothetical protein
MKIVFELIGSVIVSLLFISIPILCTLSLVYNWYPGFIFVLIVGCFVEWVALINLLLKIADERD